MASIAVGHCEKKKNSPKKSRKNRPIAALSHCTIHRELAHENLWGIYQLPSKSNPRLISWGAPLFCPFKNRGTPRHNKSKIQKSKKSVEAPLKKRAN